MLVEQHSLDDETGGFQPIHDVVDRLRIARLALDLDYRVLRRKPRKNAAMVDLDDVDAGFVELGGDRGERSRPVLRRDAESRNASLPDKIAHEDVGQQVRVDVPAAQDGAHLLARVTMRFAQHRRKPGSAGAFDYALL